jgi:hypothetical protein
MSSILTPHKPRSSSVRMLRCLVASLAFAIIASAALAIEFKPHPSARITQAQWQSYYDEVRAAHGASAKEFPDQHLVVFQAATDIIVGYAFTQPGHPAHPAWVARKIWQKEGRWWLDQVGYFAGEEAPFAKLFQQYQELNKRIMESLERENGKK